ncbi:F-box and associated interaction domains-containing protein [Trifolium repens]|nr:F-box and associated interaction domains-containing protein [Trifolium repens]
MDRSNYSNSDCNSLHDHANKNMKQNSNSNMSCKVISKLLLPQDLMIYIFTLVPLNCLINSATYVCKSWAATIRSTHFAEACERQGRSKPGLYVENCKSKSSSYLLEFKDDVNDQFERSDLGTPQEMGYVISTCDGILVLWTYKQIFVVNPVIKCWLRIPPFPSSQQYIAPSCGLAITRVPRTAKFKLFHVTVLRVSGVIWYVCYVLTIGIDNSWKEIFRKEATSNMYIWLRLLYSGGNDLYWITETEVIVMDVDREIILREYPLHLFSTVSRYSLMGDRISCIVYKDISYEIYVLDFDSGKWFLYHEMGPFDYASACGHELDIRSAMFCLWINDQIIFRVSLHPIDYILANFETIHFGYNVKTKQLTKIEGIEVGNFQVWLHTNSLFSFPSTST